MSVPARNWELVAMAWTAVRLPGRRIRGGFNLKGLIDQIGAWNRWQAILGWHHVSALH